LAPLPAALILINVAGAALAAVSLSAATRPLQLFRL
jgi:hypothetical protein